MNWSRYIWILDQGLKEIAGGCAQLYAERRSRRTASPPKTLQFPVNDICNSRCSMCNIWRRKKDREISPSELAQMLRDPYFQQIEFVGLSGGEPTLRRDLPDLARALLDELPKLRGLHIITNALRSPRVVEQMLALNEICVSRGKKLAVNVSLDGIGSAHDEQRGVAGNFENATRVIARLKEERVQVGIGCTLTPLNCYWADDVLDWSIQEKIKPAYFRLGVEIKRLYNDGFRDANAFSPAQTFHLAMFFEKLARLPETDALRKVFYQSLVAQIWEGAPRSAGCAWKSEGITLDSRGSLSFCSVQSPILDSAGFEGAQSVVQASLGIRNRILADKCSSCQHDLIGPEPARRKIKQGWRRVAQPWIDDFRRLGSGARNAFYATRRRQPKRASPGSWRSVLITGWYGTETAGDKAILGSLLQFLDRFAPSCQRIDLCTLNRRVCEQTLDELGARGRVGLIRLDSPAAIRSAGRADALIIGGGPIFSTPALRFIAHQFEAANQARNARVIFGCGIGPLRSGHFDNCASRICQLATAGFFRDEESLGLARSLGAVGDLRSAADPSFAYFSSNAAEPSSAQPRSAGWSFAGLLRANTKEYRPTLSEADIDNLNWSVASQIAKGIRLAGERIDLEGSLLPMHCLHVGGDDRAFARAIESMGGPTATRAYLPLPQLVDRIRACDATIPMRYHGHIFSIALGKPFVSIDYTGGRGKVSNLVRAAGMQEMSLRWDTITAESLAGKIELCHEEADRLRERVLAFRAAALEQVEAAFCALA